MYRVTAIRTNSGGAMSPGLNSPGKAFFAPSGAATATPGSTSSRTPSTSGGQAAAVTAGTTTVNVSERPVHSSSNSITPDHATDLDSSGAPSPPRSNQGQQPGQGAAMTNYTGAVMKQNQLRPLRLVQENKEMESGSQGGGVRALMEEDEVARKKANRGSWIQGWFQT